MDGYCCVVGCVKKGNIVDDNTIDLSYTTILCSNHSRDFNNKEPLVIEPIDLSNECNEHEYVYRNEYLKMYEERRLVCGR